MRRLVSVTCALTAAALGAAGCTSGAPSPADASIARSTSLVVGSSVLGNTNKPELACGPMAPLDPGMSPVGSHTVGSATVPNDPRRVVVIGNAPLDTLCALGLQDRVVALTPSGDPALTPRYLGRWVDELPIAGGDGVADVDAIRALAPDVIISGPVGPDESQRGALEAIAPTVVATEANGWQSAVQVVGESLGRGAATAAALAAYRSETAATGQAIAASQTEVSVVRFTPDSTEILGEASLPGQVLTELGFRRPVSQRFDSPVAKTVPEDDLRAVEGDVMYVAFQDKNSGLSDRGGDTPAVEHGISVMDSDAWRALGVTGISTRVVDDGVWVTGGGLVAARLIVADILDRR